MFITFSNSYACMTTNIYYIGHMNVVLLYKPTDYNIDAV